MNKKNNTGDSQPQEHKPTYSHNHWRKLRDMYEAGLIKNGVALSSVYHDDWCNLLNERGYCNCNPDIKITELNKVKP